ncbi:MAG: flavodoxin domain-containing protein [Candidatus Omnitrophica bacterium]|nr:flavodoxin domain-containing protein [Candidatus Omnitrophota bacterium]
MKISDQIYWTGYIDWNLTVFHGYQTPLGSSYNAYLIVDENPVLIDSVKDYGFAEMLTRIKAVIAPEKIRYLIANHAEGDHSGSLTELVKICPNAQVVCSPKAVDIFKKIYRADWRFKVVENGETLNIGRRDLKFIHMPMVHWPESMATYSVTDKILFSNDAFGQHYASSERAADDVPLDIVWQEAAKYYANIVLPYGAQVLKVLEAVQTLPVEMICPSHGLIWRRKADIEKIIGLYQKWANHITDPKALIVYDTMWHATEKMALRFFELFEQNGIDAKILNLANKHISDIMTDILAARVVLFGTPILNNRMLPTMASMLMYIKGLKAKNRYAVTFGSYGWATVGFKELEESVKDAGFTLLSDGHYVKFTPDETEMNKCLAYIPAMLEKLRS